MQKRNREVNVFSLSALDLFCSALGAIMIITVLLMPYYLRPKNEELSRVQARLRQVQAQFQSEQQARTQAQAAAAAAQAQAQAAQAAAAAAQAQAQQAQGEADRASQERDNALAKLTTPFLVVAISWEENSDVDLHVTDPQGNHFWYKQPNRNQSDYRGTPAVLEVDGKHEGNEVWLHPKATAGGYKVEYVYYASKVTPAPSPVKVRGRIIFPGGKLELPEIQLQSVNSETRVPVTAFQVDTQGNVTLP